jgi:TP901 family phage tail tape measure protein
MAGLAKVNAGMATTAGHGKAMGAMLATAAKGAAVGLGLMAVGAVKAVGAAADFQSGLNEMRAVSGATAAEMKQVSRAALDLGNDAKLPGTSARDAALAMTELAKGGLTARQAMDAARGTLMLSAAAGVENAEAAEIQADALNAFALKAADASRVADLLAASANASTSEIGDMALALRASAAVAHQAGVPIEDTVAALSNLANAGIKGSDAGTSLKTMLLRLMAPVGSGAKAIKALGLNFREADGSMMSLADMSRELNAKLGGLNKAQRDAAMAAIFGTDAIRAANIILGNGAAAHDRMKKKVTQQGAAQQLAAAKMQGFNGAMDALKSAVDTLAIQLGTALLPAFTRIAQAATTVVDWMSRNQATMKVVATVATTFGTTILLVAGYLKVAAVATAALNAVMLANPIVLVAAALAGLAAGLVLAYKQSATFRAVVNAAFNAVKTAAAALVSAFQAVLSFVRGNWRAIATLIAGPFAPIVALATDAFGVRSALVAAFQGMLSAARSAMSAVVGAIRGATGAAKGAASAVGRAVIAALKTALAAVRSVYEVLWSGLSGALGQLKSAAVAAASAIGSAIVQGVWSGIQSMAGWLSSKISSWASGLLDGALGALGIGSPSKVAADTVGRPIVQGVVMGIQREAARGQVTAALTKAVRDALRNARSNAADLASGLAAMVGQGIDALMGRRLGELAGTPEARRLAEIEQQQRAFARARERARLEDALRNAQTADERRQAQEDLDDWLLEQERQQLEDSLALREDAIRREADARKQAADRGIADLTAMLNRGLITQKQYNDGIQRILADSVGNYADLGGMLGYAFVSGFAAQLEQLMATVANMAKLAGRAVPIQLPKLPDKPPKPKRAALGGIVGGGGLTDKVPALLAPGEGVLSHRGMDRLLDMAMGSPGGGSRGGAAVVELHVHVEDQTFAGMSREQARRVAERIAPELQRRIALRA